MKPFSIISIVIGGLTLPIDFILGMLLMAAASDAGAGGLLVLLFLLLIPVPLGASIVALVTRKQKSILASGFLLAAWVAQLVMSGMVGMTVLARGPAATGLMLANLALVCLSIWYLVVAVRARA